MTVDEDVAFVQMPSTWSAFSAYSDLLRKNLPDKEDSGVLDKLVLLSVRLEVDLTSKIRTDACKLSELTEQRRTS